MKDVKMYNPVNICNVAAPSSVRASERRLDLEHEVFDIKHAVEPGTAGETLISA